MRNTSARRASDAGTGPEADVRALRSFRALAWAAAAATFALILLGAAVVGTSSGLTCLGWPLCRGRLLPPLVWPIVVEWMHRVGALAVTAVSLVAARAAWRVRTRGPWRAGSLLALALLAVQVALGGVLVVTHLAPVALVAHQGLAALLAGVWLVLALRAGWMGAASGDAPRTVGGGAAAQGGGPGGTAP